MSGDIEEVVNKIVARVEDLELKQVQLNEPIRELTPSDDLEDIKRTVNHIVKTLNKVAI